MTSQKPLAAPLKEDTYKFTQELQKFSDFKHCCSFVCGSDEETSLIGEVYRVTDTDNITKYKLGFYRQKDKLKSEQYSKILCNITPPWEVYSVEIMDEIEDLCVWLCRYCLNNYIITEEKEIIYLDPIDPLDISIDETKIPYDLIKYFDFSELKKEEEA